MRSMLRNLVVTGAATAAVGLLGIHVPVANGADDPAQASSTPTPASSNPEGLKLGRRKIGDVSPLQSVTQRKTIAVSESSNSAPPVPQQPGASTESLPVPEADPAPQPVPAPQRGPSFSMPGGVPFSPPFSGPNAFHERLRAKRIARLEQMRRNAEANGDQQGVQRAEFLEGAVNQMHNQGLFNFAQKVMGAFQSGQLSLDKLKSGGVSPASGTGSSVEMPDADLGEAAPLSGSDPLPETDLGEAAPLPTDDAPAAKQSQPEPPPALPPPASDK